MVSPAAAQTDARVGAIDRYLARLTKLGFAGAAGLKHANALINPLAAPLKELCRSLLVTGDAM